MSRKSFTCALASAAANARRNSASVSGPNVVKVKRPPIAPDQIDAACAERQPAEIGADQPRAAARRRRERPEQSPNQRLRIRRRRQIAAPRPLQHRISQVETDQLCARIARVQFAQRLAGAATRIEDRRRIQPNDAQTLGHALPDFAVQHRRAVVTPGSPLECPPHADAIEASTLGLAIIGHRRTPPIQQKLARDATGKARALRSRSR
jgi:hypothetical protein